MIRGAHFMQCALMWLLSDPHGPHSTTRRRNAPIADPLSLAILKRLTAASWSRATFREDVNVEHVSSDRINGHGGRPVGSARVERAHRYLHICLRWPRDSGAGRGGQKALKVGSAARTVIRAEEHLLKCGSATLTRPPSVVRRRRFTPKSRSSPRHEALGRDR